MPCDEQNKFPELFRRREWSVVEDGGARANVALKRIQLLREGNCALIIPSASCAEEQTFALPWSFQRAAMESRLRA